MKRLLHALAALWPLPTRTGPSPCQSADLPIRELAKSQPSASAQKANGVKRRPDERSDIGISASTLKKKTIFHLERRYCNVLAVMSLFMCLIAAYKAPAQTGAAVNMDEIKPLQIGDTIPEELWHLPLQVVNHPEGKETITLNDYRGKLIILDFWATWCVPCISSLYKLDTLQAQFGDELVVIPTTYEAKEKAGAFIANKGWSLPSAVGDTTSKKYFPHQSIPHQVWIKAGRVAAIGGAEYAKAEYISQVLAGKTLNLKPKIEVDFDASKPLFLNGNGGDGSNMLYQSVISGKINARISGVARPTPNQILAYNQTVEQLFETTIKRNISPMPSDGYIHKFKLYEIDSTLKVKINPSHVLALRNRDAVEKWTQQNLFCYNLILPENMGVADVNARMMVDMNNFFCSHLGLHVFYEVRQQDALVLKCTDPNPQIATNGGKHIRKRCPDNPNRMVFQNEKLDVIIHYLNVALTKTDRPVVDETGIVGNIDLDMNFLHSDVQSMNVELRKHGLTLVERTTGVKVIVFTNCNQPNQTI